MSDSTQAPEVGPIMVTDLTGQKRYQVSVPQDATVNEVVARLLGPMQQPAHDVDGRQLSYGVRSEKEGRFLGGNERVSDAIGPDDTLRLMPSIDAGGIPGGGD